MHAPVTCRRRGDEKVGQQEKEDIAGHGNARRVSGRREERDTGSIGRKEERGKSLRGRGGGSSVVYWVKDARSPILGGGDVERRKISRRCPPAKKTAVKLTRRKGDGALRPSSLPPSTRGVIPDSADQMRKKADRTAGSQLPNASAAEKRPLGSSGRPSEAKGP